MKVLVIAVHPDDETLGCGGTLLKHISDKDKVYWLIITDVFETMGYSKLFIKKRKEQIESVKKIYGFEKTFNLGFPTTKLHQVDFSEIVDKISDVLNEVKPEIVYTVNRTDVHTDHQITARAVMSCTKSFRNSYLKRILMYECISETEAAHALPENLFLTNAFSDVTDYMDQKLKIMRVYKSEIKPAPFPRSLDNIKSLGKIRGAVINVKYAEAFMVLKDIF